MVRTLRTALMLMLALAGGAAIAASPLCPSAGGNQTYEWVSRVSINGASVAIARTGYQDTTATAIANLVAGQSYPVQVDVRTDGASYQEYVKLWLDFDQNAAIAHPAELVFDQDATFSTFRTYSGTLTIPAGAFNGPMYGRMIMQFAASPALCGSYQYGTTVDLLVNVSGGAANPAAPSPPSAVAATAGIGSATVSFTPPAGTVTGYQVVSSPGGITVTGAASPIVVSGLTNGTSYTFTAYALNGALTSAASAPSNSVTPGFVPLVVTPSSGALPAGQYGIAYSHTFSASGANAPYTYAVTAGTLPAGLSLSPGGALTGTPASAGSYFFTVTVTDASGSGIGGPFSGTVAASIDILKEPQTVVFVAPPPVLFVGDSAPITAAGGPSGNPVVVSSTTPSVCTVTGGTITAFAAGTCSVVADQAGSANFLAAPQATQTFSVEKHSQAITFSPAPLLAARGNAHLEAVGGSTGNPVRYTSLTPEVCSAAGDTVIGITTGTCVIAADQDGSDVYQPAPRTLLTFAVFDPPANLTGLWWNSAEPGWGVNVAHQGDTVFATIFAYADDGEPLWLVASGARLQADRTFKGTLYRASGPGFDEHPWSGVNLKPVGEVSLAFTRPDRGTLVYSYHDGSSHRNETKPIERMVFQPSVPACVSSTGSRAAERNYQDLWSHPREPGWGVQFTHQGDVLFATLFTYDGDGRDLWLAAPSLVRQGEGVYAGDLFRMAAPGYSADRWEGYGSTRVGSFEVRFGDGENARISYSIDGVPVVKQITRQVFAATVPACR